MAIVLLLVRINIAKESFASPHQYPQAAVLHHITVIVDHPEHVYTVIVDHPEHVYMYRVDKN